LRKELCSKCGKYSPMNNIFTFRGSLMCETCLEQIIMQDDTVERGDIERHLDPTLCINCGRDNGNIPHQELSGIPTCDTCITYFRNRPFPVWLKVSLAMLLLVVILHLAQNRRFWRAYQELKQAGQTEELSLASALYASAARRVPESAGLQSYSAFLVGLNLLQEDKPEEALPYLEQSRDAVPPEHEIERVILVAKSSVAFEREDYDEFLRLTLQLRREYRDEAIEWARAASAYACKYAETGDLAYRSKALAYLDSARVRSMEDLAFDEYEMRIVHRLHSREILTGDEFYEKYPDGWTREDD